MVYKSKETEYVKNYNAEWYAKNKEKHLKNMSEKIDCDICGKSVVKAKIKRHQRSKKCMLCDLKK